MSCVTGDETGIVKVWDISHSSSATTNFNYGQQNRSRGVAAMCWLDSETTTACVSWNDGTLSTLKVATGGDKSSTFIASVRRNIVAANAQSMACIGERIFILDQNGRLGTTSVPMNSDAPAEDEEDATSKVTYTNLNGPTVSAVHMSRRQGLIACGGKDNELCVWDVRAERGLEKPLFKAQNVRDHVLEIPMPTWVVGASVVDYHVFCTANFDSKVRFYDRRVSERPVQEHLISRETERRRPTMLMQWNCNKFLVGEVTGDVHLYDTRRGFTSRAKMRGGVGSIRHMVKHPAGHQLLATVGLDRKAQIFHVPTGKLLQSIYLKQKGTSILLGRGAPFVDDASSYQGVANAKQPEKKASLGDAIWDSMDPVVDDFEDLVDPTPANDKPLTGLAARRAARQAAKATPSSSAPPTPQAAPVGDSPNRYQVKRRSVSVSPKQSPSMQSTTSTADSSMAQLELPTSAKRKSAKKRPRSGSMSSVDAQ